MASLLNFWNSPTKQSKRTSVNGTPTTTDARGTKRKAKADPYDAMDDDDDDVIPARKTPTSQRTARSRLSSVSATPGSSSRSRPSVPTSGKRPRGRPSLKSQQGGAVATATASQTPAESEPVHTKAPDAAPLQQDSLVPEAPMGGLELPVNNVGVAPPTSSAPKPQPEAVNGPPAKAKATETRPPQQQPKPQDKEPQQPENAAVEEDEEEDKREEHEIQKLIKHRMAGDRSGAVELLVQWEGEGEQDATWEAEEEIQQGAEETLYEYWRSQGGRISALFHKPKNPPPEIYHVFRVLRHEKKPRGGGFQFEVQWVGHSADRADTTMEAETKLKKVAPEPLEAYWESIGGRAKHLAPRGRAKKIRTE